MGIVIHSEDLLSSQNAVSEDSARMRIEGTVVLLVEDNWAHSIVMEKRLQDIGCEVVKALNGRDAIKILKNQETMVDIVFMDIQMPLLVCSPFLSLLLPKTFPSCLGTELIGDGSRTASRQPNSYAKTHSWRGTGTSLLSA
jgi:CheY-like chemotaxis protein